MKKQLIFSLIILYTGCIFSQGTLELSVKVLNQQGRPMADTEVKLEETTTGKTLKEVTDYEGYVKFIISEGTNYNLYYKDMKDKHVINIPASGYARQRKTVMYVPQNLRDDNWQRADRTDVVFERKDQSSVTIRNVSKENTFIKIKLQGKNRQPVTNFPVEIVCVKDQKKYYRETDYRGEALFAVKGGCDYEVDIEGTEAFSHVDLPDKPGMMLTKTLMFIPTKMTEFNNKDTITQQIGSNTHPTSARAFVEITCVNYDSEPLEGETVFIDEMDGDLVYKTETNVQGEAVFLLPINKKYIINYEYERGLTVIDLTDVEGLKTVKGQYPYRGSDVVEDYYKETKRDKEGFIVEFMDTKTEKAPPLDYDYFEKTETGYRMNFESQTPTSTPLALNRQLFTNVGFYKPEFYCFDAENGQYVWGIRLAESGACSAVHEDDIILINTYSCTLYAINAKTGDLLWAKWLGPIIYSTPSVAKGKVYTSYPNDLYAFRESKGTFAFICFDLKTGDIVWQNWLDAEVLAAPVITDEFAYLTTLNGTLYQFNCQNGKKTGEQKCRATTPPMVVRNKVYISQQVAADSAYEEVAIYKSKDLEFMKTVSALRGKKKTGLHALSSERKMNHNGSRMLHYKNKNYLVMDNRLICSAPEDGAIVWSVAIGEDSNNECTMPIIVNNRIILGSRDGYIRIFNPENGAKMGEFNTGEEIWIQPAVQDGIIYTGTKSGKVVAVDTEDESLTGWPMWNKDGAHNSVVE